MMQTGPGGIVGLFRKLIDAGTNKFCEQYFLLEKLPGFKTSFASI